MWNSAGVPPTTPERERRPAIVAVDDEPAVLAAVARDLRRGFGERYRVLRGASWATEQRVRSPTFRNWDLPQRRQIFAGVRLAKDVT